MSWSRVDGTQRYATVPTPRHPWPMHAVSLPRLSSISWECAHCGGSGPGFMPEHHASMACEVTKTAIAPVSVGYVDGGGI